MGLVLLVPDGARGILLILLVGALLLTFWEAREHGLDWRVTMWWLSLVLLIHAAGYLALRAWAVRSDGGTR